ncbi:thiamine pyrophosphate-dependent enzyme [Mycobacterium kyogaense]|uniref:thiamine pyrophosphate-dependent enzyme n=1 Tax=Mycobacterium kyogaense TaxID=2212479 RepID=UPI000DAD3547|nr:thiamine pyrophosphate-dependent enzyme [Mycobacterium kyogaense]
MTTVRDQTFDIFRRLGMTTIFSNPGSTEVSLLTDLPDDLDFILGLHEASVVGIATGHALAADRPALVILHTTAGLGNAVGALATARCNRAPLVVIVGQQDRRHLALEPFLAGHLSNLAGDYPVWVDQPARPQDVPGAIARAWHEARIGRGPALVIVPMDDWLATAALDEVAAPVRMLVDRLPRPDSVTEVAELTRNSSNPALVVGAGLDSAAGWRAATALAERLGCPVYQESFGARAGFPQDHPQFAGHLPAGRSRLREVLRPHDLVVTIGAPVFRQYPFEDGPLVPDGTSVVVVTDDGNEAARSPADLAILADPAEFAAMLAAEVPTRPQMAAPARQAQRPAPVQPGSALRAADVLTALSDRLPSNTVVVEETPSSRPDLHRLLPAREPLGFVSAAMGGLGFAMPAAIGLKMAAPERPVVAVLGDGSSLYSIQSLWSAARYDVGTLFVVLANGRYAIMDRLAEKEGTGPAPWPAFEEVSVSGLATSLGCPVSRAAGLADLLEILDEVIPTLSTRKSPLVLEVAVQADRDFQP